METKYCLWWYFAKMIEFDAPGLLMGLVLLDLMRSLYDTVDLFVFPLHLAFFLGVIIYSSIIPPWVSHLLLVKFLPWCCVYSLVVNAFDISRFFHLFSIQSCKLWGNISFTTNHLNHDRWFVSGSKIIIKLCDCLLNIYRM